MSACSNSFNSRAPRGARHARRGHTRKRVVSIHAPRVGRDGTRLLIRRPRQSFQFTRPAWGATCKRKTRSHLSMCFNSRAPRGARHQDGGDRNQHQVSIHAPRVGRDTPTPSISRENSCFNSRAPRGARRKRHGSRSASFGFNSRAPRGARRGTNDSHRVSGSFNSRAPRGARHCTADTYEYAYFVSIHAPRVGRDP